MNAEWRLGIIGVGMWGRVHLDSLGAVQGARATWVCDRDAEALRAVQNQYRVPRAARDHHELLAAGDVDAVVIATPPHTHAPLLGDALRAGKHVLLEKPMAATLDGADRIVHEAERHPNLVVLEGACRFTRLTPKFAFVRRMVDRGDLGDVYFVHHAALRPTTYGEYNPDAAWAGDRTTAGGGPMFDWSGYDFSFHLGVLGDRHELCSAHSFNVNGLRPALGPADSSKVEQHSAAMLEFDGGLRYYYERGGGTYGSVESYTRIHGTRGGLCFSYLPWGGNTIEYYAEDDAGKITRRELEVQADPARGKANTPLLRHFVQCLEGRAEPAVSVQLARRHMGIVARILDIP